MLCSIIDIVNLETLEELETIQGKALISLVVQFGNTRLRDNVTLD